MVREELKMTRPEVPFERADLEKMREACEAGVSPSDFCARPANEILSAQPGPYGDEPRVEEHAEPYGNEPRLEEPVEYPANETTCIFTAVAFFAVAGVVIGWGVIASEKGGAVAFGAAALLGLAFAGMGVSSLFDRRKMLVLYPDRLEYHDALGHVKVIWKHNVSSLWGVRGQQRLQDAQTTIPVGRPTQDWSSLSDILQEWVPKS